MKQFKRHTALGLFDEDIRITKLIKLGDPLYRLARGVDFELFRPILVEKLFVEAKGLGGRPAYDYVLMFKILVLQRYFNLSDDQTEFQICDRISFMRFLNLTIADDVPDSKTVWKFREQLTDLGLVEVLFTLFINKLETLGLILNEGKIVDASFVEVPKQRNTKADNKTIKEGTIPESIAKNPNIEAQKDTDARWTKKNNISFFGYKNHIKIDAKSKLITAYTVTDASVHDSQEIENLLDNKDKDQPLYADSAYSGKPLQQRLEAKGVQPKIHEKGYKNSPLTEDQQKNNHQKSKQRARVEHVFGFMENSMNHMTLEYRNMKRIVAGIGMMNMVYNMFRQVQLQRI